MHCDADSRRLCPCKSCTAGFGSAPAPCFPNTKETTGLHWQDALFVPSQVDDSSFRQPGVKKGVVDTREIGSNTLTYSKS